MSMTRITLFQFLAAFGAYFLITIALPAAVFGNRLKDRRLVERFLFYFIIGNFYIMNLVFVLQLLRISHPVTLIAGTVIPAFFLWAHNHDVSAGEAFVGLLNQGKWILEGSMGLRTALYRIAAFFKNIFKKAVNTLLALLKGRLSDWLLVAGMLAALLYVYGTHMLTNFGYNASDMPVHNYWINNLSRNRIFVAGVYPYGFHCILYYLHAVFRIDTYVLMRVFALVQNIWIHTMLLFFLKGCCKNRYTPYIGVFCYILAGIFTFGTYGRYLSSLPQEFSMLFILPSVYFLFLFFQAKKEEISGKDKVEEVKASKVKESKTKKRELKKKAEDDLIIEDLSLEDDGMEWIKDSAAEESWDDYTWKVDPSDDFDYQLDFDILTNDQSPEEVEEIDEIEETDEIEEIDEIEDLDKIEVFPAEKAAVVEAAIEIIPIVEIVSEELSWEGERFGNLVKKSAKMRKFFFFKMFGRLADRMREGHRSDQYLAGFAMSFAMTLAAHFYGTMIAGLFCIGIAVGFFFRLFRKKYFGTVMLTGILSIAIAVLPMAIAVITGTPLEGSLRWAMGVINSSMENKEEEVVLPEDSGDELFSGTGSDGFAGDGFTEDGFTEGDHTEGAIPEGGQLTESNAENEEILPPPVPLKERLQNTVRSMGFILNSYVFNESRLPMGIMAMVMIGLVAAAGVWMWLLRQPDYGAILVSVAAYMGFMTLLQTAEFLGLPMLMDASRCSIYYAYSCVTLLSLLADAILYTLFGWMRGRKLRNGISFAAVAAMLVLLLQTEDLKRNPCRVVPLERNGAIMSLTSIRMTEKDFTWTVISANDELRMVEDNGYHYELIQFLWEIENGGRLTIPTPYVYFFIEKIPLDYYGTYEGSGQSVSKEGAGRSLPVLAGILPYQVENRWIVMSRSYYWAEAFSKMYPNEMKVYLETDDFICYKLTQNPNALFNLGINYGYNITTAER